MNALGDPQIWTSLLTLTVLEIVLGVDNIVFIAVITQRLPSSQRRHVPRIGLGLAVISRLTLLGAVVWLAHLTAPVIRLWGHPVSWRDLILIAGGLFLLYKGTREIHERIDDGAAPPTDEDDGSLKRREAAPSVAGVLLQIAVLDIVFSLDSVVTAIGIADRYWVMAAAIVLAIAVMLTATAALTRLLDDHPSLKVLAFSFLLLIGMTLVADGAGFAVPKGYIYAALGFSILVETINIATGSRRSRGRRDEAPSVAGSEEAAATAAVGTDRGVHEAERGRPGCGLSSSAADAAGTSRRRRCRRRGGSSP